MTVDSVPPGAWDYVPCRRCGEFGYAKSHTCSPIWLVYNPDDGGPEDARKIHATCGGEAAEKWAEVDDAESADFHIAHGASVVVLARLADSDDAWERYSVSGESVPSYTALAEPTPAATTDAPAP